VFESAESVSEGGQTEVPQGLKPGFSKRYKRGPEGPHYPVRSTLNSETAIAAALGQMYRAVLLLLWR